MRIENFFLPGAAGRIECLLKSPPAGQEARAAALVCHPHPSYGGTMHNKVVHAAAGALLRAGMPVLRFNFRGAGLSEGPHDEGRGEQDDVRLVLGHLAARYPGLPLVVAGYSFGAYVGLRAAHLDPRVAALIAIGAPVALYDFGFLEASDKPLVFIQADQDEFSPLPKVTALAASLGPRARVLLVTGTTHSFAGRLKEVAQKVQEGIPPELISSG